jgi:hypothetical protein
MDQHFDAERLAAFADGSLSAAERAAVEAHAADCAQCLQLLAAMARTHEDPRPSPGVRRLPVFVRWAAPFAAAATGVAFWFYVLSEPGKEPITTEPAPAATEQAKAGVTPSIADEELEKNRAQESAQAGDARTPDEKIGQRAAVTNERKESSPARAREESRDASYRTDKPGEVAHMRAELSAREAAKHAPATPPPPAAAETQSVAAAAPSLTTTRVPVPSEPIVAGAKPAPSPAPSSVAEAVATDRAAVDKLTDARVLRQRLAATAPIEASAPDRRYRWRVNGVVVERSTDDGATWVRLPAEPGAQVLAIASPSANVAWFVGRAGTVLVFSDGAWTRATFPESVDLTAVRAVSSREAQITTLDGRVFRTVDGGQTWSLQETPAPAF